MFCFKGLSKYIQILR
ncbi:hypothetical protein LEMLEM_LOCUS22666 [Lemmus lemmus]